MSITEEILKKYGVEIDDTIEKEENGTFKVDSALERIFSHGKNMGKQDPDFLKSIEESTTKKATAITKKKIIKSLRDAFGLELSNSEIEELEPEAITEMIKKSSTAKSSEDVAKMQADLMRIANEKKALEDRLESEIEKVKNEYSEKDRANMQNRVISKIYRNPESKFVVTEDVAVLIFETRLKQDGLTIKFEDGKPAVYKGDAKALTDNQTTIATVEYLAGKYWSEIVQKSNGSGNNTTTTTTQKAAVEPSAHFKTLESKFGKKPGG